MSAARRGVLIAVEGIDGAGKSTVVDGLLRRWRREGFPVRSLREPSDPALGRQAQLAGRDDPWSAAMLFTIDRMHQRARVERQLRRGFLVVQDRSFYSTLAYQADRLPAPWPRRMARLSRAAAHEPDRVLLLRVRPATALRRLRRRARARGPLEEATRLRRVARAYDRLARAPRWVVLEVDALAPEAVVERAARRLSPWLRRRLGSRRPRQA